MSQERKTPQSAVTRPAASIRPAPIGTIIEVPTMSKIDFETWVRSLYEFKMSDSEMKHIMDAIAYKGFNREDVLKQLSRLGDTRVVIELIVLCALRGPIGASKTTMTNGKNPHQMGIPASGGKGIKTLTCGKITAATADLAAYYLKKVNTPKRIISELPGWLQFPSAGSIKLPEHYRAAHIEFSRKFSPIIGGEFNEQIYNQMVSNSYLDESLGLFRE